MTEKLKIVLDLVRKGAITDEQAEELLKTEKEYIYSYQPYTYPWRYPYFITTYSSGSSTLTSSPIDITYAQNSISNSLLHDNCSG